jgi:heme oxygenase
MHVALQLIASLGATLGAYGLYKALSFLYGNATSPLRHLPGPPSKGFIWGNLKEIIDAVRLLYPAFYYPVVNLMVFIFI